MTPRPFFMRLCQRTCPTPYKPWSGEFLRTSWEKQPGWGILQSISAKRSSRRRGFRTCGSRRRWSRPTRRTSSSSRSPNRASASPSVHFHTPLSWKFSIQQLSFIGLSLLWWIKGNHWAYHTVHRKNTYKVRIVAHLSKIHVQVVGEVLDHVAVCHLLLGLADETILSSNVPGNRVRLRDLQVVTWFKRSIEKLFTSYNNFKLRKSYIYCVSVATLIYSMW